MPRASARVNAVVDFRRTHACPWKGGQTGRFSQAYSEGTLRTVLCNDVETTGHPTVQKLHPTWEPMCA
jgi:hypothetical protein